MHHKYPDPQTRIFSPFSRSGVTNEPTIVGITDRKQRCTRIWYHNLSSSHLPARLPHVNVSNAPSRRLLFFNINDHITANQRLMNAFLNARTQKLEGRTKDPLPAHYPQYGWLGGLLSRSPLQPHPPVPSINIHPIPRFHRTLPSHHDR